MGHRAIQEYMYADRVWDQHDATFSASDWKQLYANCTSDVAFANA